jgi:hypothetical protein
MEEERHEGGCLCGAVRYEVRGPGGNLCYCHCNSCRRAAGAPVVAWGTFPGASFRVTRGALASYRSSAPVVRGYCARCGSCLSYSTETRPGEIDVTLASLDESARFMPRMHVWVSDKLPWIELRDGLPQFPGSLGAAVP